MNGAQPPEREEQQAGQSEARHGFEYYRGLLLFGLVIVVVAGVVLLQALRPGPREPLLEALTPAATVAATSTPAPMRVYVSGAVQKPDVYVLPPGSIVKDAVLAAGGAGPDADLDRINLAYPLVDGQQVHVPRKGEAELPGGSQLIPAPALQPRDSLVNLNTASQAELESLPGIGPALAKAILEYRRTSGPFQNVEELVNVPGIGEALLGRVRDLVSVR